MQKLLTFAALCAALGGALSAQQNNIQGYNQVLGQWDATTAARTNNSRSGNGSPVSRDDCMKPGESYFQNDAVAGQNNWYCTTAGSPGTWIHGSSSVGTVTSVACNSSFAVDWLTCSFGGSGSVTPVLQLTPTGALTQNQVLATPNGSAGAVGLRALVAGDIPSLSATYCAIAGCTLTGGLIGTTGSFSSTLGVTGLLTATGGVTVPSNGTNAGAIQLGGNTTNPSLPANTSSLLGPASTSFTANAEQFPTTVIATGHLIGCTTTGQVCVHTDVTPGNPTYTVATSATLPACTQGQTALVLSPVSWYIAAGTSPCAWSNSGSGTVTVVGSGNLTSTKCVTGGGSQTLQTPSANCSIDSSGNVTDASETASTSVTAGTASVIGSVTCSGTCTLNDLTLTGTYTGAFTQTLYIKVTVPGAITTGPSYSSGVGTSCTANGAQAVTFTNGGGSGATGTIVVSGAPTGSPSGAITITAGGTSFTSVPTTATIANCTGTATLTGGAITDGFQWSIDNGSHFVQTGQIMTSAFALNYTGVTANWGTVVGHALNETWTATLTPPTGIVNSTNAIQLNGNMVLQIGGTSNTAVGVGALGSKNTGNNNTANGSNALGSNTTGSSNIASGFGVLNSNTTGTNNTANGSNALGSNTTGYSNTASGYYVLANCGTSGATCNSNTAAGFNAGRYYGGGTTNGTTQAITTTLIGYQSETLNNNDSNETCIGNLCVGNGSNTNTIGNSSSTDTYFTGTGAGSLAILHAIGKAALNTVAVLGTTCTSGQTGLQYYVTDATVPVIGSTVAGSGTAIAMVWCNGVNWTVTGK